MFKTISKEFVNAEIVEKKSKFIANVFYIESIKEAEEKIKEIKKKYHDARHNCFAYSIYTEEGIINKFSDDGEPSGTAGAPMLNILNSKRICNVLVVVTRYFGGILLGTGGLVRAYTGAFQEALNMVEEVTKDLGLEIKLEIIYQDLEKAKYYLKQKNIKILEIEYQETVCIYAEMRKEIFEDLNLNKNNLNFKICNLDIIKEKLVDF